MDYTKFRDVSISRFILGGNPISGFSHQGNARDLEMRAYYTDEQAVALLREAQNLGVNAWVARADDHILGILREFRAAGGEINWLAQSAPELGDPLISAERAARAAAAGCHIHGGVMDFYFAQNRLDEVAAIIQRIRALGMLAGIAGHNPAIFRWALEHLDVDYFMCAYYNPTPRDENPEHIHGAQEVFLDTDRQSMVEVIPTLNRPVIHYKILAAGRHEPHEAFRFAARYMRTCDCACVGVFSKNKPGMLREDIGLLHEVLAETSTNSIHQP